MGEKMKDLISSQRNRNFIYFLVIASLLLVFMVRPALDRQSVQIFTHLQHTEYTGIEQATWVFSLAAAVLAFSSVHFMRSKKRPYKGWLLVGTLFLLFALEELSWGGRIFRFPYPKFFGEFFDGIHDLPFLIRKTLLAKFLFYQKLYLALLVILIIALLSWWKRDSVKKILSTVSSSVPAKMIFLACTMLLVSQIIDIQVIPNPLWVKAGLSFLPPPYVEECAECLAALAFLFAALEKIAELRVPAQAKSMLVTENKHAREGVDI